MVREFLHLTPHIWLTLKFTIPSYSTARPSRDLVAAAQAGEVPEELVESHDTEDN